MDRVIAGLQQRRVITPKEKRILAYHEGGHALMSHLMSGSSRSVQKATIIARGTALGYTLNLPEEERYLHTKEELLDWMVVTLAGRAAEQVVFGRVTNGAANDLEKVTSSRGRWSSSTAWARAPRRARCGPTTTRSPRSRSGLRDGEQTRLTDVAYSEALRLIAKHRALLDRVASALLEKETLNREELLALFGDVAPESRSGEAVGVPQIVAADPGPRYF